jgi:hypothetical protein
VARHELLDRWPRLGLDGATIVLGGLSEPECELMLSALTDVQAHLAGASSSLLEAAGGNPFYLEQLVAAANEAGTAAADELPHSLRSLLGARIDALGASDRTVLDLAAVLGRDIAPGQVTALARSGPEGADGGVLSAGGQADPVRTALARLDTRRLVEQGAQDAAGGAYRFANSLIHEATYQAMAKRTRADRHTRAAEVLAAWHAAAPIVATHLERAYRYRIELGISDGATDALRRRAAELLAAAGAQAAARSDVAWADSLLTRAIELLAAGEPGWAAATRQLGEARIAAGQGDEGRALLQAVIDQTADPVEAAHARLTLAATDPAAATRAAATVAGEALPVFARAGDELGQARARIRMAQERQLNGLHSEAVDLLEQGLAHAVRCDAEPERALALGAIGVSLWRGPAPVPAAVDRCRALLADHAGPRPAVRLTLSCPLAVLLALDERWDAAHAQLAAAREIAAELAYAEGAVVLPMFEAAVASLAGRSTQALALLDQAAHAARGLGVGGLLDTIARESARLLLDQGRVADAVDRLAARPVLPSAELLRADRADLAGLRGRIAAAGGVVDEAIARVEEAVAAAAGTDSLIVRGYAALDRAMVMDRLGRLEQAVDAAGSAHRHLTDKGHLPGVRRTARVRAGLARALRTAGKG